MKQFVCPECGCDEIVELRLCVVSYPVMTWWDTGEPDECGYAEVDWENDRPYASEDDPGSPREVTLECGQCFAHFEKPKQIDGPRRHSSVP